MEIIYAILALVIGIISLVVFLVVKTYSIILAPISILFSYYLLKDHKVREKKNVIVVKIAIGIAIVTLLTNVSYFVQNIVEGKLNYNPYEKQLTQEEKLNIVDKANVRVEKVGLMENKYYVVKITNDNDNEVIVEYVEINKKDSDLDYSVRSENSYIYVPGHSSVYTYATAFKNEFSEEDEVIFDFELSQYYQVFADTRKMKTTVTDMGEKGIAVKVENGIGEISSGYEFNLLYYKDDKLVNIQYGMSTEGRDIAIGESTLVVVEQSEIEYDRVEVQMIRVQRQADENTSYYSNELY
jgi:energy-coupling factor transporter transmembrane protein EcfT